MIKFRKLLNRYFASVNVGNGHYKIITGTSLNVVCEQLKKITSFPMILAGLKKFRKKMED